jgi:homoserine O-acetyltransferase
MGVRAQRYNWPYPLAPLDDNNRPDLRVVDAGSASIESMPSPEHPRNFSTDLPVTGAWQPGDPVGHRQFVEISPTRAFVLENGESLHGVVMAYETWGELNEDASNAVLVCHALTGDSHVAGPSGDGHPTEGWWGELVGRGSAIDTNEHFVVCINVLGGCQGSTGPASIDPATGARRASSFPTVTIRDIVRAQAKVADHLGVYTWKSVLGGSMGGMQVLEWAIMFPDRVRSIAPVATTLAATALQIAWSAVGRSTLVLDPKWRGGDYYDAPIGDGPHAGLSVARSIAQIHYRSDMSFGERFGRSLVVPDSLFGLWDRFQMESYLNYHGEKLVRRFDANSYLVLNRAMDTHDLARGRGSLADAVRRIKVPVVTASISSDVLYLPDQQAEIHDVVSIVGGDSSYTVIENSHGHDGFLLAAEEIGPLLHDLLSRDIP